MANFKSPRFKLSRRLGLNVYGHPKAMNRVFKGSSRADKKLSEYGQQLLEKQRLRAYYGVMEKQFAKYVNKAKKSKEQTGHVLVQILESRLDNLVYRIGIAASIRQARQMVVHGHILVDNKKIDIPSFLVQPDSVINSKEKSRNIELFKDNFENAFLSSLPYISKDKEIFGGVFLRLPDREEVPIEIEDQLVVEYYS